MVTGAGGILSHYRLVEKIGEGGIGVVWKAHDLVLDRLVAIKVLSEALASDHEWMERLEREARAVAALNHPNIVTIHSVEQTESIRFITMELVQGKTLAELLADGGLPLRDFLETAVPLVDAVVAAHRRGIIHRDLKPSNVMVSDEGRVKVLDFGLATFEAREARTGPSAAIEAAARRSGTLAYMSPEQLLGRPIDPRSDVFALGVLLYEMATGRHPFSGEDALTRAASILNQDPLPPGEIRPDLPPALGRIIVHCLAKDVTQRLASARELRRELEELKRERDAARRAAAPSIAVLPFADLSREKDQEYFCDGIAEEVINALARLGGLRIASRSTAFRYRNSALSPRQIGRELDVDAVLEGGVRRSGDRLRVTAAMTQVSDGHCPWSESYDREIRDVFAIQEEIARSIAQALELTLSPSETRAIAKTSTTDIEAYDFYLRGRSFYYHYSKRGIGFALQMFSRAIERDPGYALAHAGIADCHSYLYLYVASTEANRERAEAASLEALKLDRALAQAHASHGLALSLGGRHEAAEEEFEAAIRLNDQLYEAFYFYARDSFVQGKLERAVELYEKASALRPEDYQAPLLSAQVYSDLGRQAEADAARRRGLRNAEEHLRVHPDDVRALYMAANAMAAIGERARGLEWAERALELDPEDSMLLYNVACIRSLAGQVEGALDCLERAVRAGLVDRGWIENDSNLGPLRGHPRYRELLERLARGG